MPINEIPIGSMKRLIERYKYKSLPTTKFFKRYIIKDSMTMHIFVNIIEMINMSIPIVLDSTTRA